MSVVENEAELEVLESELYEMLPTLETSELEILFQKMSLNLPTTAQGKKNMLLRLLNKQLGALSETEDQGFATIKLLHEHLIKKMIWKKNFW